MTHLPMAGVRVVEAAQFTYTPAAGAVLADWGADVIKIEHHVMGDAQRGMQAGPASFAVGSFKPIMEHPNRGKRSIGLALHEPAGLDVFYDLVRTSDVFVTNFLPDARERLKIDVDDVRAVNPRIIYVRGSAFGARGPRRAQGRLRLECVLVARRWRCGHHATRGRRSARHARARVRRLDRWDDDRGRHRGCALRA